VELLEEVDELTADLLVECVYTEVKSLVKRGTKRQIQTAIDKANRQVRTKGGGNLIIYTEYGVEEGVIPRILGNLKASNLHGYHMGKALREISILFKDGRIIPLKIEGRIVEWQKD